MNTLLRACPFSILVLLLLAGSGARAESIYLIGPADPTSVGVDQYRWDYAAELVGSQSYVLEDDGFKFTAYGILSLIAAPNWYGNYDAALNEVTFRYDGAAGPIGPGTKDLGTFSLVSSYDTGIDSDFLAWDHKVTQSGTSRRYNTDVISAPGAYSVPEPSFLLESSASLILGIALLGMVRFRRGRPIEKSA